MLSQRNPHSKEAVTVQAPGPTRYPEINRSCRQEEAHSGLQVLEITGST